MNFTQLHSYLRHIGTKCKAIREVSSGSIDKVFGDSLEGVSLPLMLIEDPTVRLQGDEDNPSASFLVTVQIFQQDDHDDHEHSTYLLDQCEGIMQSIVSKILEDGILGVTYSSIAWEPIYLKLGDGFQGYQLTLPLKSHTGICYDAAEWTDEEPFVPYYFDWDLTAADGSYTLTILSRSEDIPTYFQVDGAGAYEPLTDPEILPDSFHHIKIYQADTLAGEKRASVIIRNHGTDQRGTSSTSIVV